MDYILDTHIAMWAIEGNERLSKEAVDIISDEENNIYFSALSVMKSAIVAIKNQTSFRKLSLAYL